MKKSCVLLVLAVAAACSGGAHELWARGGRGGGGFHGGGGMRMGGGARPAMGGGAMRPAVGRTPSMSLPSRPNFAGGARPGGNFSGGVRPGGGGFPPGINRPPSNRPALGNLPTPGVRPGTGRPAGNLNRPGYAGGGTARPGSGGRPTPNQLDNFLHIGGGTNSRPGFRPPGGGAASDFLKDLPRPFPGGGDLAGGGRPATRPGQGGGGQQFRPGENTRPDRPATRPGSDWGSQNHRPDHRPDWNDWHNWAHGRWDHINDHGHDHWHDWHGWYGHDWWSKYHGPYHFPENANWWAWATWGAVTNWFPAAWGWSQPIYYNYGSNVYYQDDAVYYGDQPIATADEYADQAQQIATSIPEDVQPEPEDWMPLGVFAVTSAEESSTETDPTNVLQLAVSRQGIIAGTLQNTSTGTVKQIEGMVDKQSQRAAWTVAGQTRPIMETGIGNLTQDTAGVLVHFADGTTQQWLLVRLKKPQGADAETATPSSAVPPQ